jgi:hypothetical protein
VHAAELVQCKPKCHPGAYFAGGSVVRNCGSVPALANAVFDALMPSMRSMEKITVLRLADPHSSIHALNRR